MKTAYDSVATNYWNTLILKLSIGNIITRYNADNICGLRRNNINKKVKVKWNISIRYHMVPIVGVMNKTSTVRSYCSFSTSYIICDDFFTKRTGFHVKLHGRKFTLK